MVIYRLASVSVLELSSNTFHLNSTDGRHIPTLLRGRPMG
ncbi:unnamed protein product [Penicillium camemberti]|uniref:Str. FM013 n=1 Tax=Penicillium camemberti (strain FM 013) TaxID=1429867 RepID=A0A0G4P5W8_PENC3|nr:unnamed protein product [Penicillium camemberti]